MAALFKQLLQDIKSVAGSQDEKPFYLDLLETFLASFVVLMVLYWTVAFPETVAGASMSPTLYDGEKILVTRLADSYERGDIVVLNPPGNDDIDYVKRIVGIPGDIIKIFNCGLYVSRDGERFQLEEPYLSPEICTVSGPKIREGRSVLLKDNEYLVLGDNRANSQDSRYFGVVSEERVVGRVVARFWPLSQVGFL